jgi:thioredoxin-related protein
MATNSPRGALRLALPLALFLLVACGRQETSEQHPASQEIAWFDGSVEQAFEFARANDKPIFLYWGAAWCPPCHEIKATVFRSREFIERSRLFVPVYLDGDTDNAQELGERFGLRGYPTMIVFSPDAREITRIPGGIDIQAYANVLDLALERMRPATEIVARVVDDGAALDASDCRLMAYYSWDQNPSMFDGRDPAEVYRKLSDACPATSGAEASMLYLEYLRAAIATPAEGEEPVSLGDGERQQALARVEAVLDDAALIRANLYTVLVSGARITNAITAAGTPEREALQAKFLAALDRLSRDETLFVTERLYALIGRIRFERIADEQADVSPELRQLAHDQVARADAETTDPYARQALVNVAAYVLVEAGLREEARQMLVAELERSKQPYYFMVDIAHIEQEAGNYDAAIEWLKRAYDESRGPATRFQWGTYYVLGLLEMTPDDSERIEAATIQVVHELEASRAFYQRPKAQLQRLEQRLEAWNAEGTRGAALQRIRQGVLAICGKIPEQEAARATCDGFLAPA